MTQLPLHPKNATHLDPVTMGQTLWFTFQKENVAELTEGDLWEYVTKDIAIFSLLYIWGIPAATLQGQGAIWNHPYGK